MLLLFCFGMTLKSLFWVLSMYIFVHSTNPCAVSKPELYDKASFFLLTRFVKSVIRKTLYSSNPFFIFSIH